MRKDFGNVPRPLNCEGFYEETLKYGIKDLDLSSGSAPSVVPGKGERMLATPKQQLSLLFHPPCLYLASYFGSFVLYLSSLLSCVSV